MSDIASHNPRTHNTGHKSSYLLVRLPPPSLTLDREYSDHHLDILSIRQICHGIQERTYGRRSKASRVTTLANISPGTPSV